MKVRVIKEFYGIKENRLFKKDETIEVTEERAKEFIENKVAEKIKEQKNIKK